MVVLRTAARGERTSSRNASALDASNCVSSTASVNCSKRRRLRRKATTWGNLFVCHCGSTTICQAAGVSATASTPCAGTALAVKLPATPSAMLLRSHRSRTLTFAPASSPSVFQSAVMSLLSGERLRNTAATELLWSGLAQTSAPKGSGAETRTPWTPPGSWRPNRARSERTQMHADACKIGVYAPG